MTDVPKKTRGPLCVYWQAAIPEWGKMLAALGLACAAAVLEIIPYVIIFLMGKEALSEAPQVDTILWLTGGIFGAVILRFIAHGGSTILGHLAGFRAECRLRCQLIERMKTVVPAAVEGKSGQLSRTVMDEVGRLHGVLAHTIPDAFSGLFLALVCAVALLLIDWRLTMAALVMLVLGIWAQGRMTASPEYFARWMQAEGRAASALLFYVRGLATLRAFNRQAGTLQEVTESIFAVGKLAGEVTRICSMPYALFGLAMTTPLLAVLPCAFWFYANGTLTISKLLLFVAVSGVLLLPLTKVVMSLTALRALQTGAVQIEAMMNLPRFMETGSSDVVLDSSGVTFENVSYRVKSASDEDVALIRNASFTLAPGSITTVTGPSGSGKTTLARLLARLDDVSDGRILIGGQDIRSIPPRQFQSLISIVFQDAFLFHGTIRENILLARPDATESELLQAVQAAGCAEMLQEFPLGLDTPVGDKGFALSGGERQRIAVVRAFLKDAPILILDEATAHLDPIAAREVSRNLERLMAGRTVFAISHRLCDIENAAATLVVVAGSLEEKGTHKELLQRSPTYGKLWGLQEQSCSWRLGNQRTQERQA